MHISHVVFELMARRSLDINRPVKSNGRVDFSLVRRAYEAMTPELMAAERWIDPYFVDWTPAFTPIESAMWSLIRSQEHPFYPQFPVGRFFVDFGDPHRRIAIECDGRQWHSSAEAQERDYARDRALLDLGWKVVRFSGRACVKLPYLPDLASIPELGGIDAFWPPLEQILEEEARGEDYS